jgi:hypothetical protein
VAETKPTQVAEWADTGSKVEPSEAKKDSGWVAPELPPDTYFNWWQNLVGNWTKWINERLFDGGDSEDFKIQPPTPAGVAGDLTLKGGDGVGAGGHGGDVFATGGQPAGTDANGGFVVATGGNATGTGTGGGITATAGNGGPTGSGGSVVIDAGNSGASGGSAGILTAKAGDKTNGQGGTAALAGGNGLGTDEDGGQARIDSGSATGDGSADVALRAVDGGQGAGTTTRSPADYLRCDGSEKKIVISRDVDITPTGTSRGPMRLGTITGQPATPTKGEFTLDETTGKLLVGDGTVWEWVGSRRAVTIADSSSIHTTAAETAFDQKYTIPAASLRPGDRITLYASGEASKTGSPSVILRIKIDGQTISTATYALTSGIYWEIESRMVVRAIGLTGTLQTLTNTKFYFPGVTLNHQISPGLGGGPTHTIDFSIAQDIEITADWDVSDASNSIKMTQFHVDIH